MSILRGASQEERGAPVYLPGGLLHHESKALSRKPGLRLELDLEEEIMHRQSQIGLSQSAPRGDNSTKCNDSFLAFHESPAEILPHKKWLGFFEKWENEGLVQGAAGKSWVIGLVPVQDKTK